MRQGEGERAGLGVRQPSEQLAELVAEQQLRRTEHLLPRRGQGQCLPAAVGGDRRALDQPGLPQPGQHLGDSQPGDAGPAGKLSRWEPLLADGTEGKVLSHRQRRLVAGQQPLGPPRGEQGDDSQHVGGAGHRVTRPLPRWHR